MPANFRPKFSRGSFRYQLVCLCRDVSLEQMACGVPGAVIEFFFGYPNQAEPERFIHASDLLQRSLIDKKRGRPHSVRSNDPAAVVQSARYAPDGKAIILGDLIPVPWRDLGITTFRKRVGFSQNLGPAQQTDGIPAVWTGLRRLDVPLRLTANAPHVTVPSVCGARSGRHSMTRVMM